MMKSAVTAIFKGPPRQEGGKWRVLPFGCAWRDADSYEWGDIRYEVDPKKRSSRKYQNTLYTLDKKGK